MTHTFTWIEPEHVLQATLPATFDDPVARQFDQDVMVYLDNASQPINIIVDMRFIKLHPSLKTILDWKYLKHEHLAFAATVGLITNPASRFISSIIMRSTGLMGVQAHMKDFKTLEDATAYIAKVNEKP